MGESSRVQGIISWLVHNPLKSIISGLLIVAAVSYGASRLTTNFGYRIWFDPENKKLVQFDAFERRFGSDEIAVIIVHSPSGIFDKDSTDLLREMTHDMWRAPEVIRVDSLTNFNWVHGIEDEILVEPLIPDDLELTNEILKEREKIALDHPSINGYLINDKGDTSLIFARLKPSLDGTPDYEKITTGMREVIKKYESRSDHQIFLTGNPILNFAFKESTQADMAKLVPLVLLATLIFLLLSFRRVSGVLLPLLIIGLSIATTMGSAGWFGIQINNLTAIAPQFMIAVAIAVAVHVLVSFYQFFNKGMDKRAALVQAATKNLRPTLLTALSTAIGFYSFTTSPIPPISNLGAMAGTGTLFSWLLTYMVMVPLMTFLPLRQKKEEVSSEDALKPSDRSIKAAQFLYEYRKPVLSLGALSIVVAVFLASKVEVNSDPFNYFDKTYPLSIATDFVEKNIGGAVGAEIVIDSGKTEGIKDPEFMNRVEKFQTWVDQIPFVTKTVSIVDILKDMNKTLNGGQQEFYRVPQSREMIGQQIFLYTMNLPQGMDINDRVTIKNDAIRLTAMWTVHDSNTALGTIKKMEAKAKEFGLNAHVTGKMPLYQSNNDLVVESFLISISLAIFLVGILLIIGLGSWRLGLFSMIPNAIPLVAGGGLLGLIGQPLDIGTVIVGSICLGIAVDDTIHFLANYRRYLAQGDTRQMAVARVFTNTAPALFTTTLVLVTSFAVFALGSFVPNQNFGKFVASILSIALIADLTFLPSLLMSWDINIKGASPKPNLAANRPVQANSNGTDPRPEVTL